MPNLYILCDSLVSGTECIGSECVPVHHLAYLEYFD